MKIKNLFSGKKDKIKSGKDYFFGKYKLKLMKDHCLPIFQKKYPLYDRFFPLLCSGLDGLIIDVGANIGDTSLAIYAENENSFIVGVEADNYFFNECVQNINSNKLSDRFLGVNKFLTTNKGNFIVNKSNSSSTGSIQVDENNENNENNSISFSELINLIPMEKKNKFDVLKSDTDGFDWDILNSFYEYSKNNSFLPKFIFFEMQTFLNGNEKNVEGRNEIIDNYLKSINKIASSGYSNFCLFDNFGTFIKKTKSVNEIFELVDYIKRSQIYNNHSTIYYFDILAYSETEEKYVETILNKLYQNENIV